MKKFLLCGLILFSSTFYFSCTKDKTQQKTVATTCSGIDSATNTYNLRIKNILNNNCALGGCHDNGTAARNVILDTYTDSKTAFQNKPCLCTIKQNGGCLPMPQGSGKLADSLIAYIQCWADNGYHQ